MVRNTPTHHASSTCWLLKFEHSHSTPLKQPIHKKISYVHSAEGGENNKKLNS